MKTLVLTLGLLTASTFGALAQTPAVAPKETNPAAPVQGANSFTEAQAKERIEKAGYTNVSALKMDEKGVWRGTAMKAGATTPISLDFQGNVVSK